MNTDAIPDNCQHKLMRAGVPYPRTCARCDLFGTCPFYTREDIEEFIDQLPSGGKRSKTLIGRLTELLHRLAVPKRCSSVLLCQSNEDADTIREAVARLSTLEEHYNRTKAADESV